MSYQDKLYTLQNELWVEFDALVKKGALFPELLDVEYPYGINPPALSRTTEGRSHFYAKEMLADPNYKRHIGEDIIVDTGAVTSIDTEGQPHHIDFCDTCKFS